MKTLMAVLFLVVLIVATLICWVINTWVGIGATVVSCWFVLWFFHASIRKIPADPPTKGVLVFLGKRQQVVLDEGWRFLPFYPIIFDVVMVKVVKVNQDLSEQLVRTPDLAEIGVTVSITWTPGVSSSHSVEEQAEVLISFLNSGGEKGVANIIADIIKDRLRTWAFSKEEGPANWQEAVGSKEEAIAILIKAILGDDIPPITSTIPTTILLKYFNSPQQKPFEYERKRWGRKSKTGSEWEGLEKELSILSSDEHNKLQKQVAERREIIKKVRQGNGVFHKKSLGITINRFTINDIILKGKLAEAAELEVKEKHERNAEIVEIKHILQRVLELRKSLDISAEQALEIVQTERKKITKTISESKLNISPETRAMFEKIVPEIFDKLFKT